MIAVEQVGPGRSLGGDRGYWQIHHQADADGRPRCGRTIPSRDTEGLPLILSVPCAACRRAAQESP